MAVPLLETKTCLPHARRGLVARPRLVELLNRGAESRLLLISAPAGFGKTTLLAEWLSSAGPTGEWATAWVSLDRGDNDPAMFWSYVIAALQKVDAAIGADELVLLSSSRPPPMTQLLTTLMNDIEELGNAVLIVLDDFQTVDSTEILDAMQFLIERLPAQVHVVIATRADPSLLLGRMRGQGELVEIRASDLRFTDEEAAEYLNGAMGLELTDRDVAVLEERTEGWIAALQLAALSMQGRDDVSSFIEGFNGDDRYVVDFLVEEVLQRQPEDVRQFLLRTCLLGRLNGALCDAVSGIAGGRARLEALDKGNLFVVQLDDRRDWYRYHHLFADVLRARLADESPALVPLLHRRASDWYAGQGESSLAIEHALAGDHFERAADLFELALPVLRPQRKEATLLGWLKLLPDDVLGVRPVLSNSYAGALLATGEVDDVDRRLRDAERWVDSPGSEMVIVDEQEGSAVPAGVAIHRAGLSLMTGNPAGAVAHAQRALTLLRDDDDLGRGAATALIGLASWASGDLATAHDAYMASIDNLQRAGHVSDVLGCSIAVADIEITQGHLREAKRTYERVLKLAGEQPGPTLRGTADMYVGLSALHLERNDLAAATQLLEQSEEFGEHCGLPQNRYRWRVALARVREAEGNVGGAADLLDEAEKTYVGDFSPNVRPVPATRARVWLRQGKVAEALGWARDHGLSSDDDLHYLHEYEHTTLARALLVSHSPDAAALLGRLLEAARAGQRTGSIIEILVLQAVAHQQCGDHRAAVGSLESALSLAEPEGYARVFIDEGRVMASILKAAAPHTSTPAYVGRLLAACVEHGDTHSRIQGLVDPLSHRERDVLRLLGSDLAGPEIARELFVSLNTMRTHTKSIYAKLGVNNRRAAVRRARELDQ